MEVIAIWSMNAYSSNHVSTELHASIRNGATFVLVFLATKDGHVTKMLMNVRKRIFAKTEDHVSISTAVFFVPAHLVTKDDDAP